LESNYGLNSSKFAQIGSKIGTHGEIGGKNNGNYYDDDDGFVHDMLSEAGGNNDKGLKSVKNLKEKKAYLDKIQKEKEPSQIAILNAEKQKHKEHILGEITHLIDQSYGVQGGRTVLGSDSSHFTQMKPVFVDFFDLLLEKLRLLFLFQARSLITQGRNNDRLFHLMNSLHGVNSNPDGVDESGDFSVFSSFDITPASTVTNQSLIGIFDQEYLDALFVDLAPFNPLQ